MLISIKMGKILAILVAGVLLAAMACYGSNSSFNSGQEILQQIEPYFSGEPLFLSKNHELKTNIKNKLLVAIDYISQADQEKPNDPMVLFLMGKAYSFAHDLDVSGAWQKSVEALKKCIDLDPANIQAHLYLAKNYMDAQRFEDAYQLYRVAYMINPKSEAQKFMAFSLMYQKKTLEAISAMKEYISFHPDDKDAKNVLQALEENRFTLETGDRK